MSRHWPLLLVLLLWIGALGRDGFDRWVSGTDLPVLMLEQSVEVRDRHGALLRTYTVADGRWRLPIAAASVDSSFLTMLLAYEDKRFWHHSGVDLWAMLRAAGQALRQGHVVSGGSTLTMQVARLLEEGSTGRWAGKIRQIRLALALERQLTKDEILNLYLNLAPYGGNIEGVRAASLAYFGKEPKRLTAAQSALLVALPQAPEARRPDRHPEQAAKARQRVLRRLNRAGVVTQEQQEEARRDPVPQTRRAFPALAPHATDRAVAMAPDHQKITLSLDATLQEKLQELTQDSLRGKSDRLSMAILAADHRSGEILASVGSPRYKQGRGQGFVDMTQAVRSPGSTLKPLVYALGFDRGLIHPDTLINDRPVDFSGYAPQNFDGQFRGQLKAAEALRLSLNIPVVLLTEEIGPHNLMAALRRSGAKPQLPGGTPGLAVALGGVGISLQDLVQLYAGLANSGKAVDFAGQGDGARIVSRSAAWQVGHILSSLAPPRGQPQNRLAYKTGTSYGHRDAWAIGFDGAHVIGVWIGRPDGTPVPGAFGGDLAAPVLFEAFQRLKPQLDPLPPPPPETLLLSTAQLPPPLQRFRGRHAVFTPEADAPKLIFPPEGAQLDVQDGAVPIKLRDGVPPFTLIANGAPLRVEHWGRQAEMPLPGVGRGYVTLSVIDAKGRSDRTSFWLR